MSWGTQRRNRVVSLIVSVILIVSGAVAFIVFYEEPNCFDGKQNSKEIGIDCGGNCELLCSSETLDLLVLWYRYFEVAPGIYNVLALIENQNLNAGADQISYKFDLLDENGISLDFRTGKFNIKPKEIIPIFESGLDTGKLKPARMSFVLGEQIIWQRQNERDKSVIIKDESIDETEKNFTKIKATILNVSVDRIEDIYFIVIIYDEKNNAFASSSTFVELLPGSSEKDIVFTWPKKFDEQISKFEIIPLYE